MTRYRQHRNQYDPIPFIDIDELLYQESYDYCEEEDLDNYRALSEDHPLFGIVKKYDDMIRHLENSARALKHPNGDPRYNLDDEIASISVIMHLDITKRTLQSTHLSEKEQEAIMARLISSKYSGPQDIMRVIRNGQSG